MSHDAVVRALNSWCGKTACDWPDDPCDVHRTIADLVRERDEALAETERARREADYEAGGWDAHDKVLARAERAEAALREISEWDMLNPPQTDLVSDLAWLRAVVDRGLGGAS